MAKAEKINIGSVSKNEKFRMYIYITILLLILAALSIVLAPKGSALNICLGVIIQENKNTCLYNLATTTKNASICSYLPSPNSDSCYVNIGETVLDPKTCLKASNRTLSDACILYISNQSYSPALCNIVNNQSEPECLTNLALRLNNQNLCQGIKTQVGRNICSSSLNFKSAISLDDIHYCDIITNSTDQNVTQLILLNATRYSNFTNASSGSSLSGSINYLRFIPNVSFSARDLCYTSVASSNANASECLLIKNVSKQTLCINVIRGPAINQTLNNTRVNYTELLKSCYLNNTYNQTCRDYVLLFKAIQTKNASICGSFDLEAGYQCYLSIARQYNDTKYCSYIANITLERECVQDISFNPNSAYNLK